MNEQITELLNLYIPSFIEGAKITLQVTGVSIVIGIAFGIPAAVLRVYGNRWARLFVRGYLELFRGTPLLVQLFIFYYGLPEFGITLSRLTAAYLTDDVQRSIPSRHSKVDIVAPVLSGLYSYC